MTLILYRLLFLGYAVQFYGCAFQNRNPKAEWRQNAHSNLDTFYPGVKFGMAPEEVRTKIPPTYRVEMSGNLMRLSRRHPDGSTERIVFGFEGKKLIDTRDTTSQ